MPRPSPPPVGAQAPRVPPPSRRNVAVLSLAEHFPTPTASAALRVKAALSKAAWWPWLLTFWPWKWCPSHVWRGLPLCQFLVFLDLSALDLGPMYATDRRRTSDKSIAYWPHLLGAGHNKQISGSAASDVLPHCDINDLG